MIQLPPSALDQLLTPCLVVDVPAASRNIRRCAAFFSGQPAALRPHFKAHKCTTLMRQQLAAGGCAGVACQTSWEALVLARAGFRDILIANQVVDAAALDEVAEAEVLLIPAHVDPAVNLYDRLFAWSGTEFTEWEVDGRRRYRLPGVSP